MEKSPILIAGMHQSGTSMITQLLQTNGLYLGLPLKTAEIRVDEHQEGIWENPDIVNFGNEILSELGGDWAHPPRALFSPNWVDNQDIMQRDLKAPDLIQELEGSSKTWGWNDTRNTILLPFWQRLYPELRLVIGLRNPLGVALSLARSPSYEEGVFRALLLWLQYHVILHSSFRRTPFIVTHYDSYFYSPMEEIKRICDFINVEFNEQKSKNKYEGLLKDIPYRGVATDQLLRDYKNLPDGVLSIYEEFCLLAGDTFQKSRGDLSYQKKLGESALSSLYKITSNGLSAVNSEISALRRKLSDKDNALHESNQMKHAKNKTIRQQKHSIQQQEQTIQQQEQIIHQQEQTSKKQQQTIHQLEKDIKQQEHDLRQKAQEIQRMEEIDTPREAPQPQYEKKNVIDEEPASEIHRSRGWRLSQFIRDLIIHPSIILLRIKFFIIIRQPHRFLFMPHCFDGKWYLRYYPDVAQSRMHPFHHYLYFGWKDMRNPNPYFDTEWYLREYRDVELAQVEPLSHYLRFGWKEKRNPGPRFHTAWYLRQNADVRKSGMDPLTHYLKFGMSEGRLPSPHFDLEWHNEMYPSRPSTDRNLSGLKERSQRFRFPSLRLKKKISRTWFPQDKNRVSLTVSSVVKQHKRSFGEYPSILDWNCGLELEDEVPGCEVINYQGEHLPYIQNSIDIIVKKAADDAVEARHVGARFIISIGQGSNCQVIPLLEFPIQASLSSSIIFPANRNTTLTQRCLESLIATIPPTSDIEIIVVDDEPTDQTYNLVKEIQLKDKRVLFEKIEQSAGYCQSCNYGAKIAVNEILIFVQNDITATDGWLDPLLDTFIQHEDAGVVGGKILSPDGTLQEAGRVLFKTGEYYKFGATSENHMHPLYSHFREVDFCTGVLLATPRELFEQLRGFDPEFASSSYEYADYCMKVGTIGKKIYFQPESAIIHDHPGSYSEAKKQLIKKHQALFAEKWGKELERAPSLPGKEINLDNQNRLVSHSPRALICGTTFPNRNRYDHGTRLFNIMTVLQDLGWHVSYYSWETRERDTRLGRRLSNAGFVVYLGSTFHRTNDQLEEFTKVVSNGDYDLIVFSTWQVADALTPIVKKSSRSSRLILNAGDLQFQRISRKFATKGKLLNDRFGQEMMAELNSYANVDTSWIATQQGTEFVSDLLGLEANACYVPNIVHPMPLRQDVKPFSERHGILVVVDNHSSHNGELEHFLTNSVLDWLSRDIYMEHPLYIIGGSLSEKTRKHIHRIDRSGLLIRVLDKVPSLTPYLQFTRIMAVPNMYGAGNRLRIISAKAYGLPIITTQANNNDREGNLNNPVEWGPGDYAHRLTTTLFDEKLWTRLMKNGIQIVQQENIIDQMRNKIEQSLLVGK